MTTIYAVPLEIQETEITHYCFGLCGKVILGGVFDTEFGGMSTCREADCPYLDMQIKDVGHIGGEPICFRKLKAVQL